MKKTIQKASALVGLSGLILMSSSTVVEYQSLSAILVSSLALMFFGGVIFFWNQYSNTLAGIKNNGVFFNTLTNRGLLGLILGVLITFIYVLIYWYPKTLGYNSSGPSTGLISLFDPLSYLLNGKPASRWFVYGSLYTFAIVLFGIKFIYKYRNNRYQVIRTVSVMFFQFAFAYYIPEILSALNPDTPYFAKDLKNIWPLNYYFFDQWHLKNMLYGGGLGMFFLVFGLALVFIISPILTYFYGKRWYCSWVCGCGGLAETAGDAFRQLSSKKLNVWKIERLMIHAVLVFIFITTIAVIWSFLGRNPDLYINRKGFFYIITFITLTAIGVIYFTKKNGFSKDLRATVVSLGVILISLIAIRAYSNETHILFIESAKLQKSYGFFIGAAFSGVLGVGFYPILGSRVWCRFGCPAAAILGIQQRLFSRFRITTNGGQCISCGNCSVYCEMGIDVRSYAQRGENIVRSSCVGCGICAAVCPRGVLKLENDKLKNRMPSFEFPLGNNPDITK